MALNNFAFLVAERGGTSKDMDEAVERRRDESQIIDTPGRVYFQRGEYDKARGQLQRLLDKGPDNPIVNYHLGMVLYKQGRTVEATGNSLKRPWKSRRDMWIRKRHRRC